MQTLISEAESGGNILTAIMSIYSPGMDGMLIFRAALIHFNQITRKLIFVCGVGGRRGKNWGWLTRAEQTVSSERPETSFNQICPGHANRFFCIPKPFFDGFNHDHESCLNESIIQSNYCRMKNVLLMAFVDESFLVIRDFSIALKV